MRPPAFEPEWHNALMSDRERGYAHRVDVRADIQQVWRALTEVGQLTLWCSPGAEIRPCKGGLFRASVDRVTEFEAHIDVFEPGRRLRLIYLRSPALPPADSVLVDDFLLEPVAGGTIVRLLGSGVPATPQWDTQYRRLRTGWQQAMTRLKVLVEKQGATP
ncbi:MAG: SRPBCC domain-containing protein [Gammaproteobacteria bacterium]|nr:MAG: SRPBCC domain-containing protein [Gammaproteobacteria bacterium]